MRGRDLALWLIALRKDRSGMARPRLAAPLKCYDISLYLIHKPIYHLAGTHFGDTLKGHALLASASYAAPTVLGAALLHYLVERLGLLLRNRAWTRVERGTHTISAPDSGHL
jgi:hypothetical protein